MALDHLKRLVELNVLLESDNEGATMYSPDPLYMRMQVLRELLDEHGRQGLDELRDELQEQMDALEGREQDLAEYRLGLVEEATDVRERYTSRPLHTSRTE
nr:hypothetical protein [Natronobacterium gregoryi]